MCVGVDDVANIYVNGASYGPVTGVQNTSSSSTTCFAVSGLVVGTNSIALQAFNSNCCYNWATWSFEVVLSSGVTQKYTSNSGSVTMYNQTASYGPAPPTDGTHQWYETNYVPGTGWAAGAKRPE